MPPNYPDLTPTSISLHQPSVVIPTAQLIHHFFHMATPQNNPTLFSFEVEDQSHEFKQLLSSLPKENRWRRFTLYQYQGFWLTQRFLHGILTSQQQFQARHTDLILATPLKSGTTWLKALGYAIVNREQFSYPQHPLLTNNPHDLIHQLESEIFVDHLIPDLEGLSNPRLFGTHMPYSLLPESIKRSNSKVVYLCRDPRDTFVSYWRFVEKVTPKDQAPLSLEEMFHLFASGISNHGPLLDHILGYWKASLKRPHKVMFLKYEDLKREPNAQLKILADFLGYPFSPKEEKEGVVDDIVRLCSFENLSNLDVNKSGKTNLGIECNAFFWKGDVGNYSNFLTPQMIQHLDRLIEQKLQGSGLSFQLPPLAVV